MARLPFRSPRGRSRLVRPDDDSEGGVVRLSERCGSSQRPGLQGQCRVIRSWRSLHIGSEPARGLAPIDDSRKCAEHGALDWLAKRVAAGCHIRGAGAAECAFIRDQRPSRALSFSCRRDPSACPRGRIERRARRCALGHGRCFGPRMTPKYEKLARRQVTVQPQEPPPEAGQPHVPHTRGKIPGRQAPSEESEEEDGSPSERATPGSTRNGAAVP